MDTKVLAGLPLLAIGAILLLWTTLSMKSVEPLQLGIAAVAAVGMAVGSLLIGTSEEGRSV
ncbi:hypothetical protein EFA46_006550 [Halarchaeum sp. CBA1220]|uniref:Uncharacterized protein n=1 Tax=Halarchaeum grantii TaxID=1193105 RepID=A0A830EUJ4_9EURY|nr:MULTISPECIES: hypothetical protein [Halarchaeum]QLC33872.1 hypothetical protein EFA46_006550 [Halarchaeum sp. CBA1220]GGL31504.1 hypothetical protein GCM10009037_14050 [Halarchaeum grantii]